MSITKQTAKQLRDIYFGGNWTWSCFKEHLAGLTWKQATIKVESFNTIAVLVYHTNYYLNAVLSVLQGNMLTAKHNESFNCPAIFAQEDWEKLLNKTWADAETFANAIEQLPENKLEEIFIDEKYGTYYRNITGVIEHNHYHLGQIVFIKKIIFSTAKL